MKGEGKTCITQGFLGGNMTVYRHLRDSLKGDQKKKMKIEVNNA